MNTKENTNTKTKTVTIVTPKEKIVTPRLYKIILHNNPITSFEAVMTVLTQVFQKSHQEANTIMMTAHTTDRAVVMRSSKEICEGKLQEVRVFLDSRKIDELFPGRPHYYEELEFTMEEDD